MVPPSLSSFSTSSSPEDCIATTAVAIDKDKNSQFAVRWAVENLLKKGSHVILVHVRTQSLQPNDDVPKGGCAPTEIELQQFFLPYRGFCARKGVRAKEVVLHDIDISSALVDFIHSRSINIIVLGASNRSALTRVFRNQDVPTRLCKTAPNFCAVYVIVKGKVQHVRSASQASTTCIIAASKLKVHNVKSDSQPSTPRGVASSKPKVQEVKSDSQPSTPHANSKLSPQKGVSSNTLQSNDPFQYSRQESWRDGVFERISVTSSSLLGITNPTQSPISSSMFSSPQHPRSRRNVQIHAKGIQSHQNSFSDLIDFSGPPSFQSTDMSYENLDQFSTSEVSQSSVSSQASSILQKDIEAEMRRLKLELKLTMDMYNSACKEAIRANEKAKKFDQWKSEEARRLQQAKQAQQAAWAVAEMEKQRTRAAIEAAQMAKQLAEFEVHKRKNAEMKAIQEAEERNKAMGGLGTSGIRYRKYTIEQIEIALDHFSDSLKVGEGGYGPVYKGILDHTAVAIKILRPEMSQGRKQFQREVEVLSYIRHPNMVLLLGACPEYGCLVYEYMENGSLEDRLFRKNNTAPISWRLRFRIATEVATSLLFLHQTKPEPLVHRDLKPANILLDRNYVSKIGDVGLARLVPPSVADSVTQYQMTAAAGTFYYIDPEYQRTGLLGVKSDIYSLGITLLQMITGKSPIGITHIVGRAIESGKFSEILDPAVTDWPVEEAMSFANLALKCCELKRKDRPDLGAVILPELQRLASLGSDRDTACNGGEGATFSEEVGISHQGRQTEIEWSSISKDCGRSKAESED